MKWLCVRTYANGAYQNKIFPYLFKSYSSALGKAADLNKIDSEMNDGIWVPFPIYSEDEFR